MKVILTDTNEIKEVKTGYARNFLLPRGKAVLASKGALREAIGKQKMEEVKLQKLVKKLEGLSLKIKAKAGESGTLFGAVGEEDVLKVLKKKGFEIDKRWLKFEPIKNLGRYKISVVLRKDLIIEIGVEVTGDEKKKKEN